MNKVLNLPININDNLQILTEEDDDDFKFMNLCSTEFSIWLKTPNQMLRLHRFAVGYDFYYLVEEDIKPSLDNQRKMPVEFGIKANLGLLWNEHKKKFITAYEEGKSIEWDWPGGHLLFLENKGDGFNSSMTFLYNDEQGNIILEVCSAYPWFFEETPSADEYVSYEDWLPKYKTLYKTIISKDVAKQWVKELETLYKKLNANMLD